MSFRSGDVRSAEPRAVRPRFGGLVRSLVVSVVIPLIIVQVLLRRGTPPVTAFAIAAVFPFAEAVLGLIRKRQFDLVAVLSLVAIVAGIGTAGLSGNPAFAVAKESVFTFVFGCVFLGSLLARRPLIFTLGRQYAAAEDPAEAAAWEERWEIPGFRRVVRLLTAVWGGGLLVEAFLRVIIAFTIPVIVSSILSPVLGVGVILGLIGWTLWYVRRVQRRAAAAAAANG